MTVIKNYLELNIAQAEDAYRKLFNKYLSQIVSSDTTKSIPIKILDVGCADGKNTLALVKNVPTAEIHGLEIVEQLVTEARERGILAVTGKADEAFPYLDAEFDVIISNQVIEHLANQDLFLKEIHRILKPGGTLLICTDNLSSWHNVGALFMGWQPFPMTNFSEKQAGIGNPLALHRGEDIIFPSMLHTRLFTSRALKELLQAHSFQVEVVTGTGYYPLPGMLAKFMANLNPAHSAFQFIKAIKQ